MEPTIQLDNGMILDLGVLITEDGEIYLTERIAGSAHTRYLSRFIPCKAKAVYPLHYGAASSSMMK